jgi:hypothetical protein
MSGESDYQSSKCMIKKIAYAERLNELYAKFGGVEQLRWIYMQTEYGTFVVFPEVSMMRKLTGVGCSSDTTTCLTRELKRKFALQALLTRKTNVLVVDMNKNIENQAYIHELIESRLELSTEYEYFVIIGHSLGAQYIYPKDGVPVPMTPENLNYAKIELREVFYKGDKVPISDFKRATELAFKSIEQVKTLNLCSDNIIYISDGKNFADSGVGRTLEDGRNTLNSRRRFRVFTFIVGKDNCPLFQMITCRFNGVSWSAENVYSEYHIKELYSSLMYDPGLNASLPKWSTKTEDLLGLGDVYTVSMMCERKGGKKRGYGYPAIVATDVQVSQVPNPSDIEREHVKTVRDYCPSISDKRNDFVLRKARSQDGFNYCDGVVRSNPLPYFMVGTHFVTLIVGIVVGAILIQVGRKCLVSRNKVQGENKYMYI